MSSQTKKFRRIGIILTILSFLLCFAPAAIYIVMGYATSTLVVEKVGLTCLIGLSIILSFICLVAKTTFRSSIWLSLIGLWLVLDNIVGMIIIVAVTQVFDELVVAPLARHFRAKAKINKEIDKRCLPNP